MARRLLTVRLTVHALAWGLTIWGVRRVVGVHVRSTVFRERLLRNASRARWRRVLLGLVTYGRQLDSSRPWIRRRCAVGTLGITILRGCLSCSLTLALFILLALGLFLLLTLLPFFPNFFEFFRSALLSVALHCDVSIQMIQRAIRLLAAIPSALIHALDLFVSPARPLVLLRSRDGNKRIDLIRALLRRASGRVIHVSWSQW